MNLLSFFGLKVKPKLPEAKAYDLGRFGGKKHLSLKKRTGTIT